MQDDQLLTWITFLPFLTGLFLLGTGVLARTFGADGLPPALWRGLALDVARKLGRERAALLENEIEGEAQVAHRLG